MRKKGVAGSSEELVNLVAREWSRQVSKNPVLAKSVVAGEGVCTSDELDMRKLGQLSESRLKTIYKRLTGKSYA